MRKFLWLWVLLVAASCAGGRKLALVKEGGAAVDVAVGSLDDVRDDIARSDAAHGGTQTLGGDVILRIANGENMHR